MATFPSWISKRNNNNNSNFQNLSPRQMANKAHSLAVKKLDKDDKRKRPQYSIRERLLLSKTMFKAEKFLNKKPEIRRSAAYFDADDDMMPPFKKSDPPVVVPEPSSNKQTDPMTTTEKEPVSMVASTEKEIESCAPDECALDLKDQIDPCGQNEPALATLEQMAAVSLIIVSIVASLNSTLNDRPQKSTGDFCRNIMIPSHSSLTAII